MPSSFAVNYAVVFCRKLCRRLFAARSDIFGVAAYFFVATGDCVLAKFVLFLAGIGRLKIRGFTFFQSGVRNEEINRFRNAGYYPGNGIKQE